MKKIITIRMSPLARALLFSFMSYLFVLFVIIVLDTFARKDFDFGRATRIAGVYIAALVLLFTMMIVVFRKRLTK